MYNLPYMTSKIAKKQKSVGAFSGINMNIKKDNNELTESVNMSAKDYPCLAVRNKRSIYSDTGFNVTYMGAKDIIYYTGYKEDSPNETTLTYGENSVSFSTEDISEKEDRMCAHLSDSVLIMPDKLLYTPSENKLRNLTYSKYIDNQAALQKVREQCASDFTINFPSGLGFLSNSSITSNTYSTNGYTTYLMGFDNIEAGDIIHISMDVMISKTNYEMADYAYVARMKEGFDVKVASVKRTSNKVFTGTVNEITTLYFDENAIDMGGYSAVSCTTISIEKKMPDIDYMCTLNNRIWGVSDNTIRCSKLGEGQHWFDFSADAFGTLPASCFYTDVDSEGSFTAITSFGGTIVAFKENCIHKIYGTEPANFTLSTLSCNGVEAGGHKTLATINGILYYKGFDGIYIYDGSMPVLISQKTDLDRQKALGAGTDGINYYLSVQKDGEYFLYVYYPAQKAWHMEKVPENNGDFVLFENNLYLSCKKVLWNLTDTQSTEKVEWKFSLEFDEKTFNTKEYGRLMISYNLGKDAFFTVKTICDANEQTKHIDGRQTKTDCGISVLPLPLIKCNKVKIIFEGKGDFVLKEICREYFEATEFLNNQKGGI